MSSVSDWNHRWFGFWKEMGPKFSFCPSIKEFRTGNELNINEKKLVLAYLKNGFVVATTSRLAFPCVITGKRFSGSISYRTDGHWLWFDDLGYYVECFGVALPLRMLEHIRANQYTIPQVSQVEVDSLEYPGKEQK